MIVATPILLVAEFFPPDTDYTAFAERCRALADKFGTRGFSVHVIVLRRSPNDPPAETSGRYHLLRRNPVATSFFRQNFPTNMIQRLWALFDIMRAVKKTRSRLILISAHDPMYYVAALIVGKVAGIPVITDAHDSRLVLGASTTKGARKAVKQRIEQFAMRRASRIWVPTSGLATLIHQSYSVPEDHFQVVPNGVDASRFQSTPIPANDGQTMLHLGGPRAYYDSATLVRAFKRVLDVVPRATLIFLGIRADSYTSGIIRLCDELGIGEAVQFLPPAPPSAVAAFTCRSAIGIHTYALAPAYAATIGLKVMEYMAAGLPVLHRGPKGGETWKLVDGQGVGVCAESESDLAMQAIGLLQDPIRRKSLGDRGRAQTARYDWQTTLEVGVTDARRVIEESAEKNALKRSPYSLSPDRAQKPP